MIKIEDELFTILTKCQTECNKIFVSKMRNNSNEMLIAKMFDKHLEKFILALSDLGIKDVEGLEGYLQIDTEECGEVYRRLRQHVIDLKDGNFDELDNLPYEQEDVEGFETTPRRIIGNISD